MSDNVSTAPGLIMFPGQQIPPSGAQTLPSTMTAEQLQDMLGPWLPRLQLYTANSTIVKERRFPGGHWGLPLTPTTIIDLGPTVDVVFGAVRDKALIASGENFQASTNKDSEMYKKIRDLALSDRDSGAMFGPEFLTWIGTHQLFATLFLGTISARREAYAFMQAMGHPARLSGQMVGSNPRKRWEVPAVTILDVFAYGLPSEHDKTTAWKKFTAPDEEVEAVDETQTAGTRER